MISECVEACLKDFGYGFWKVDGGYRFHLQTTSGMWYRAQFLISEPHSHLRLIVHLDAKYLPSRQPFVQELVNRLDDECGVLGGFCFNVDYGAAYFRYGIDLRGTAPTAEMVERVMNCAAYPLRLWEAASHFITSKGHITPASAVSTALILSDGADANAYISAATKKQIMQLV